MCKVHDGEPELARLSRLRKSQIKVLLVASSTVRPFATRLQAWPRRQCLEAQGLGLSFWPLPALGQEQEPTAPGSEGRCFHNASASRAVLLWTLQTCGNLLKLAFRHANQAREVFAFDNRGRRLPPSALIKAVL